MQSPRPCSLRNLFCLLAAAFAPIAFAGAPGAVANARADAVVASPLPTIDACATSAGHGAPKVLSLHEPGVRPQKIAKPAKGVVFRGEAGTCVVRVTAHDAEPPTKFARNDYSRREPFNADDTRLLVYGSGGYWYLYDAHSLHFVKKLVGPAGDAEPQWDATDPDTLFYLPRNGGMTLLSLDVRRDRTRTRADFRGKLPWPDVNGVWTKSEGSPSKDMRYWGFQAEAHFKIRGYFVYDLVQQRVIGTHAASVRPDHVSMTPSGRWLVASDDTDGTWAWTPDFSQKKKLHHKSEHSDLAIGADGHDEYVSIDFQSSDGEVFFVDIDACPAVPASADPASTPACPRTRLFSTYRNGSSTSVHVSGKAYAKPGWVVISTYGTKPGRDEPPAWPWFTNAIFAVELATSPRVYRLGFEQDLSEGYWTEPHGAPNRTLTRVVFNSNWNTPSKDDVDEYMIALPPDTIAPARKAKAPAAH